MALHFPGAYAVTIAPTLTVISFSSLVSGGQTLKNYVMSFAGGFRTHSLGIFFCAQRVFSSYVKTASFTLSFSGVMVFGGAHGMWITTACCWFWTVLLDS